MRKLIVLTMLACALVAFARDYNWTFDKSARTTADTEMSSSSTGANAAAVDVSVPMADAGAAGDLDSRLSFDERFGDFTYCYRAGFFLIFR